MCSTCFPGQKVKVPRSWRPIVMNMTDFYLSRSGYTLHICEGCRYRLYVWLRRNGMPSLLDVAVIVWVLKQHAIDLVGKCRERRGGASGPVGARE